MARQGRFARFLLRMDASLESVGPNRTIRRVYVEASADFALGPAALRPDVPIDILGAGRTFDGPHVLAEASLHFDLAKA